MEKINIKFSDGNQWMIKEVRHILYLKRNLFLAIKFDGESYMIAFSNNAWKVTKGSMIVARGNMVGMLYLITNTYNDVMDLASRSGNVSIIHHKFGQDKKNELGFDEKKRVKFLNVGNDVSKYNKKNSGYQRWKEVFNIRIRKFHQVILEDIKR